MNDILLATANQNFKTTKISQDVQTQMRDVKNHIIKQYQMDEYGRPIELSLPELASQEVQTDVVEEPVEEAESVEK